MVVGYQDDDLPKFGMIEELLSVKGIVFVALTMYINEGIYSHYHSYVVGRTCQKKLMLIKELDGHPPTIGHTSSSQQVYILLHVY